MSASDIQSIATALGIVGAGAFFLFKAVYGYNNINLSLSVSCDRCRKDDVTDFVTATVSVEKGANTALSLLHGEVRFISAFTPGPVQLSLHRLETVLNDAGLLRVVWDESAPERALFVSPGERMHFACFAEVPQLQPCQVETVLLGRKRRRSWRLWRRYSFLCQWRATAVSLPRVKGPADIGSDHVSKRLTLSPQ